MLWYNIKEVKAQNLWKLEERVAEQEDTIYFGSSILMSKDQNFINDLVSIGDYVEVIMQKWLAKTSSHVST